MDRRVRRCRFRQNRSRPTRRICGGDGGKQVTVPHRPRFWSSSTRKTSPPLHDFPVKVASLSRFNNSKATKAALEGMADGTVDIVIGTHKLVGR